MIAAGDVVSAEWSPDLKHVCFLADADLDENFDLWVVGAPWEIPKKIVDAVPAEDVKTFEWSSDGQQIILTMGPPGGPDAAFTVEEDGANLTPIDPAASAGVDIELAIPSPSTPQMVVKDGTELVIMNLDGTGEISIDSGVTAATPVWSPDGLMVAWIADGSLLTIDADGTDLTAIDPGGAGGTTTQVVFAADGQCIAVIEDGSLFVMAPNGSGEISVDPGLAGGTVTFVEFNTNGLEFAVIEDGSLYTFNKDGTGETQVDMGGTVTQASWSSDNIHIAMIEDGDLWTITSDGATSFQLNRGGAGIVSSVKWLPGGDQLVFASDWEFPGDLNLWSAFSDGSKLQLINGLGGDPADFQVIPAFGLQPIF